LFCYRAEDYLDSQAKKKIILIKSVNRSGREGEPHISVGWTGQQDPKVQFKSGGHDLTTLGQLARVPIVVTERGLLKPWSYSLVAAIGSRVIGRI
jgi:hypothetical protein